MLLSVASPYILIWYLIFYKQVQGQLSLSSGAALTFGLAHYASSAFELIAEELLMSDSLIKVGSLYLLLCCSDFQI